jgi:hypothetical protein
LVVSMDGDSDRLMGTLTPGALEKFIVEVALARGCTIRMVERRGEMRAVFADLAKVYEVETKFLDPRHPDWVGLGYDEHIQSVKDDAIIVSSDDNESEALSKATSSSSFSFSSSSSPEDEEDEDDEEDSEGSITSSGTSSSAATSSSSEDERVLVSGKQSRANLRAQATHFTYSHTRTHTHTHITHPYTPIPFSPRRSDARPAGRPSGWRTRPGARRPGRPRQPKGPMPRL